MKFWDTSAIIPLLVIENLPELQTKKIDTLFLEDSSQIVWWGTTIECVSAIARLERESALSSDNAELVLSRLSQLRSAWREVQASNKIKTLAERILRLQALRAQDAQQLAACLFVREEVDLEFVTLDKRLSVAAKKEGLNVIDLA